MLLQRFDEIGTPGTDAVVLCFDLEGFSRFFRQPDVHLYAPEYLNVIISAVQELFGNAQPSWLPPGDPPVVPQLREPDFAKFMGDGGIYIWTAASQHEPISSQFKVNLLGWIWALQHSFDGIVTKAREVVPLVDLPQRMRFGVSRGTVYGLRRQRSVEPVDYVGFAINLAARLQSYCREIGFIASARLALRDAELNEARYQKVLAIRIPGFDPEYVLVERDDFATLDSTRRTDLFVVEDAAASQVAPSK